MKIDPRMSEDAPGRGSTLCVYVPVLHLCDMPAKPSQLLTRMLRKNGTAEAEISKDVGTVLGLHPKSMALAIVTTAAIGRVIAY